MIPRGLDYSSSAPVQTCLSALRSPAKRDPMRLAIALTSGQRFWNITGKQKRGFEACMKPSASSSSSSSSSVQPSFRPTGAPRSTLEFQSFTKATSVVVYDERLKKKQSGGASLGASLALLFPFTCSACVVCKGESKVCICRRWHTRDEPELGGVNEEIVLSLSKYRGVVGFRWCYFVSRKAVVAMRGWGKSMIRKGQ